MEISHTGHCYTPGNKYGRNEPCKSPTDIHVPGGKAGVEFQDPSRGTAEVKDSAENTSTRSMLLYQRNRTLKTGLSLGPNEEAVVRWGG
jgi:hypothetical protein